MKPDTRSKILDAAEALFAQKGFKATTIRDITSAAKVNVASIHYHFRGKEAVLEGVFERLIAPVNHARLARLNQLQDSQADGQAPQLEAVMRAFLEPTFQKIHQYQEEKPFFMKLIGRIHMDSDEAMRAHLFSQLKPVIEAFSDAFQRAVPHLSKQQALLRMQWIMGGFAHFCMGPVAQKSGVFSHQTLLEELVAFAVSGMAATTPTPTEIQNNLQNKEC